jgi:hypothetical protein
MELAPRTVQCVTARLRRVPTTTLQPASIIPEDLHSPSASNFGEHIRSRLWWRY